MMQTKFKKFRKRSLSKYTFNQNLVHGDIGLKATQSGFINARQIEASRQSINRRIKRSGKILIRVHPNKYITKKSSESRMGKGKGSIYHKLAKVSAGKILFELCGVTKNLAIKALATGKAKLPLKTQIII